MSAMPPGAPYSNVVVGEPVEIAVYEKDGALFAEFEFRGDTFGLSLDLEGLDGLDLTLQTDTLVTSVAMLAYHELGATPRFRDEDEPFVARVDAQRPWEKERRVASVGWIANYADEVIEQDSPAPESRSNPIAATLGDADVSGLRLSQEEMAALTRGEIPSVLIERLLRARSTENLIESAIDALRVVLQDMTDPDLERAALEMAEVRRRFQ